MLRIIVRRDDANMVVHAGGVVLSSYRTIDIEAPEVEEALLIGGANEDGSFCHAQVVGVEIILP